MFTPLQLVPYCIIAPCPGIAAFVGGNRRVSDLNCRASGGDGASSCGERCACVGCGRFMKIRGKWEG